MRIYSVYDSKAEVYLRPFTMNTKGEALRAWADLCNDEKTQFNKHPEDFTLFEIGTWDDNQGRITQHTANIPLGTALEYTKSKRTLESVQI